MNDTTASLRLGDLELLDDTFAAQVGTSFGGWESITATTQSLFLDGAIVSGEASSNREIRLQVRVQAPDRFALVEACEALLGEANKQSNTLTFTPPVGPVVVYEVFRVQSPRRIDDESEAWRYRDYELVFPALPFARSVERESTGALSPSITITGFEAAFTGSQLERMYDSNYINQGGVYYNDDSYPGGGTGLFMAPVDTPTTPALAVDLQVSDGLTAVSGCTIAYPTVSLNRIDGQAGNQKPVGRVTGTGGVVEVASAATWATTADVITVAINWHTTDYAYTFSGVVGIEWLDAAGAHVRTDWGTPMTAPTYSTIWTAAPRPANAASVRFRVRPDIANGASLDLIEWAVLESALETVTPGTADVSRNQGQAGIRQTAQVNPYTTDQAAGQMPGYLYGQLPAPVDVSAKPLLSLWVKPVRAVNLIESSSADTLALRLFDSAGRSSRYQFTPGLLEAMEWVSVSAVLADPTSTSDLGPVDLTDVAAFDIDMRSREGSASVPTFGIYNFYLDAMAAGEIPTSTNSTRGTVYDLEPIIGSARTTAQVAVSAEQDLADWLVAAVPADHGSPLLAVAAGKAAAIAPARYAGVYSLIGGLAAGQTSLGTSCTITQKINGTTVATKTLTGLARGNYIDYGAVALPLVAVPDDNQGVSFEFTFAAGSTGDLLLIDVDASLAWVESMGTPQPYAWIDEPDAIANLGKVWVGSVPDRSDARALAAPPTMSRPLQVKAPATRLLVYSTTTAPDVSLSYYPRWLIEPTA